MAYFPLFIDLADRRVLVVGGGDTALRKTRTLREFGADVVVVSPQFDPSLLELAKEDASITLIAREYSEEFFSGDLALVIAATDDPEVNRQVAEEAKRRHIPVNSVDDPENCTFYFPAIVKDDDVVVGVSSGGKSPLVTQHVKKTIKSVLPDQIGEVNREMGEYRKKVREEVPGKEPEDQKKRASMLRRKLEELL